MVTFIISLDIVFTVFSLVNIQKKKKKKTKKKKKKKLKKKKKKLQNTYKKLNKQLSYLHLYILIHKFLIYTPFIYCF